MKVGIIDYGGGNARSVINAISFLGKPYVFSNEESRLNECSHLILPGVGSFGKIMESLKDERLVDLLNKYVLNEKRYYLGICVGMQILMEEGEEFGRHCGLGWIKGKCLKLDAESLFIPHIGWNSVQTDSGLSSLFKDIPAESCFYFVHSYAVHLTEKVPSATCSYGVDFVAAFMKGNIFGVQFHPEKSQKAGLQLLKNFCGL